VKVIMNLCFGSKAKITLLLYHLKREWVVVQFFRRSPALHGWNALAGAVDPDGRLGQVQQIADRPGPVDINDTQLYGSGALLPAGTATRSMIEAEQNYR
jgi:hypothetical protein